MARRRRPGRPAQNPGQGHQPNPGGHNRPEWDQAEYENTFRWLSSEEDEEEQTQRPTPLNPIRGPGRALAMVGAMLASILAGFWQMKANFSAMWSSESGQTILVFGLFFYPLLHILVGMKYFKVWEHVIGAIDQLLVLVTKPLEGRRVQKPLQRFFQKDWTNMSTGRFAGQAFLVGLATYFMLGWFLPYACYAVGYAIFWMGIRLLSILGFYLVIRLIVGLVPPLKPINDLLGSLEKFLGEIFKGTRQSLGWVEPKKDDKKKEGNDGDKDKKD